MLAPAERVGPIRVITNWHGYFRQSAGPGWALVGDAGHFKDFATGQGISDALRQTRSDRSATAQLLGVMNHDLSPAILLTPGRMAGAAIRALRDRPEQAAATLREIASTVKDRSNRARHRNAARGQIRASTASGRALRSFASAVSRVSLSITRDYRA